MNRLAYLCFLALLALAMWRLAVSVKFTEAAQTAFTGGRLPEDDTPALVSCCIDTEQAENELIQEALLARANVIENCTITWYTDSTCGKRPGDPAYGITASGLDSGERMIAPGPPERHTVRCGSCGCRTKFYSRSCDAVKAWERGDLR